ncbi:hypothetical protein [Streptomyces sp. NP-1717]|uniref:hypothetical protein n=1 Tax=Streptomyces sp. NP-1717 TaxID=2704470 RepID=UPI001F5CFC0A|nr:hypothetical protein [Streptomyces sp. NP-1717]MCI3221173.1 hypothetical protein [Streptomyces sp. NP-1717]
MVDFYGFCLQDADDTAVPVQWPEGFESVDFVSTRTGRIDVRSAGHTHTAGLTLEVWDEEPELVGSWEMSGEGEVDYPSGTLRAWAVAGGPMPYLLEVSERPGPETWCVRVHATGRAEVARLASQTVPHGVEQYLVQLWPKR